MPFKSFLINMNALIMIILACSLFFHSDFNRYCIQHSLIVYFSECGHWDKKSGAACFISLEKKIVKTSPCINIIILIRNVWSKTAFTLPTLHTVGYQLFISLLLKKKENNSTSNTSHLFNSLWLNLFCFLVAWGFHDVPNDAWDMAQ